MYGYDDNELSYYGRVQHANYDSEIRTVIGAAAGVMETDQSKASDLTAYNIFGSFGYGAANLDVEYMTGTASKTSGDEDHKGYSAQLSYAINNAPLGAWELVYRYSTVESSGDKVGADEIVRRANFSSGAGFKNVHEVDQNYLGVNYLFAGHDAKFMLGYEMNSLSKVDGTKADADGFRARVQFLF